MVVLLTGTTLVVILSGIFVLSLMARDRFYKLIGKNKKK